MLKWTPSEVSKRMIIKLLTGRVGKGGCPCLISVSFTIRESRSSPEDPLRLCFRCHLPKMCQSSPTRMKRIGYRSSRLPREGVSERPFGLEMALLGARDTFPNFQATCLFASTRYRVNVLPSRNLFSPVNVNRASLSNSPGISVLRPNCLFFKSRSTSLTSPTLFVTDQTQ